ncbi:hypothetical protein Ddye_029265 [Dipteronia dyeriana]|uniref:Pentatricopeptide repeat-containing protein n=1 Tax=Dipteronia dyeriana TaxID=168575 RepID=A0AAD9WLM9_9ROSI|nr:hypothetical protein Ddye_029265 [Dipteronia dyeriana]
MTLGYAQNGCINEPMIYICEMRSQNLIPYSFTMVSVFFNLVELSVIRHVKCIHAFVVRSCFDKNIFVTTALIDMYAKCGAIDTARKLFDMMNERPVTMWNAMIDAYGTHGHGKAAVELFNDATSGHQAK